MSLVPSHAPAHSGPSDGSGTGRPFDGFGEPFPEHVDSADRIGHALDGDAPAAVGVDRYRHLGQHLVLQLSGGHPGALPGEVRGDPRRERHGEKRRAAPAPDRG